MRTTVAFVKHSTSSARAPLDSSISRSCVSLILPNSVTPVAGVCASTVEAVHRARRSDNGRGIAADDLPRVFDRFRRIDQDGFRGEAALGLGLPLTRQFVEAHGGTVELESTEGKGTTVRLLIPRGER